MHWSAERMALQEFEVARLPRCHFETADKVAMYQRTSRGAWALPLDAVSADGSSRATSRCSPAEGCGAVRECSALAVQGYPRHDGCDDRCVAWFRFAASFDCRHDGARGDMTFLSPLRLPATLNCPEWPKSRRNAVRKAYRKGISQQKAQNIDRHPGRLMMD